MDYSLDISQESEDFLSSKLDVSQKKLSKHNSVSLLPSILSQKSQRNKEFILIEKKQLPQIKLKRNYKITSKYVGGGFMGSKTDHGTTNTTLLENSISNSIVSITQSLLLKTVQCDESPNHLHQLRELFGMRRQNLLKASQILSSLAKDKKISQICRSIQANSVKLQQALQMLSPPLSNDTKIIALHSFQQKVKKAYIQMDEMDQLCVIELQKLMRLFEFAGIDIDYDSFLRLLQQLNLLYIDKYHGYFTEYCWLLSVIGWFYHNKIDSTKLLKLSLQPDPIIKRKQLSESDIPRAMIKVIEQRNKEAKFQKIRQQLRDNALLDHNKKLQSKINRGNRDKQSIVSQNLGLEPPINGLLKVYDSHQDLYDTLQHSEQEIQKYEFFAIEVGYLNINRNKHLLTTDADLKEEYTIFGSGSGNEYPVWMRILYQSQSKVIALKKIHFYDPTTQPNSHRLRDFYSTPSLLPRYMLAFTAVMSSNDSNGYTRVSLQNSIQEDISLKYPKKEQLIYRVDRVPDILLQECIKGSQWMDEVKMTEEDTDEEQMNDEDLSFLTPLFIKQIQSYPQYHNQTRISQGFININPRDSRYTTSSDKQLEQQDFDIIKDAFYFKEQFLKSNETVEIDMQSYPPYGCYAEGSSEEFLENEEFETIDSPLTVETAQDPQLQKDFFYIPASTQNYTLQSPKSHATSVTWDRLLKTKVVQKKQPFQQAKFLKEMDCQTVIPTLCKHEFNQGLARHIHQEYLEDNIQFFQSKVLQSDIIQEIKFESVHKIPILYDMQNKLDTSEDISFDEQPIQFTTRDFLDNKEVDPDFEFCNGLIHKRECIVNYEDGSGVSQINIYHKDRMVHSIEGQGSNSQWSIKFFLPQHIRKYTKQKISIPTQGQEFTGVRLLTHQFGNKHFLSGFQFCAQSLQNDYIDDPQQSTSEKLSVIETIPSSPTQMQQRIQQSFSLIEMSPIPPNWNIGQLKIMMRYSSQYSTKEQDNHLFNSKLEWFKWSITELFTNIQIEELCLNSSEHKNPEQFEVLIQGVGPISQRIAQNFYPLFIKNELMTVFLYLFEREMEQVFVNLTLLAWFYGGMQQMGNAQKQFFATDPHKMTKYPYKFIKQNT